MLSGVHEAVAEANLAAAEREAHRLAGGAGAVGAGRFRALCKELEAARAGGQTLERSLALDGELDELFAADLAGARRGVRGGARSRGARRAAQHRVNRTDAPPASAGGSRVFVLIGVLVAQFSPPRTKYASGCHRARERCVESE